MPFEKGESGNPGGKSPLRTKQAKEAFLPHIDKAVQALVNALDDEKGSTRVTAAKEILDRIFGKPAQSHELGDSADKVIHAILQIAAPKSE